MKSRDASHRHIGSAKSYLKRTSLRVFPMRWRRIRKGGSISMILLFREPRTLFEDIRLAAERAWGLSFTGAEGSTRFASSSQMAQFSYKLGRTVLASSISPSRMKTDQRKTRPGFRR